MPRIRQTKTDWQKAMESYPGEIQWVSWADTLPEVLHISMALIDNDYQTVKADFHKLADYVNANHQLPRRFHFNLTHTIKLIKQDSAILDEIKQTSFKGTFDLLLLIYKPLFNIDVPENEVATLLPLFKGYEQILDGRANAAILCKYLMMQYENKERPDPFGLFNLNSPEEVLLPQNVANIMASFPVSIGLSEDIDKTMCHYIWLFNYIEMPHMPREDDSDEEALKFKEMNLKKSVAEFKKLNIEFQKINMLALFPRSVAEINMGFVSRICNLTIDIVDLVKNHRGEIAELTFRSMLESFIIGTWLLKRKDAALYQRFKDYSTGREKFMGERFIQRADDVTWKAKVKEYVEDTIKESGQREINVASERGSIFDLQIADMTNEIWGQGNVYYDLYKRASEAIHGDWRIIAKYHLAKSYNPMQNGLYWYNQNPNHFAGLVPAFKSLGLAAEFLSSFLNDIESEEVNQLKENIGKFRMDNANGWMKYFNKYIIGKDEQ